LKTKNVCARLLIAIVFPALTLGQTLKPIAKSTDRSQADLRYAKAIELIRDTATEATLWDDKRMAIVVLSNAADLLWDDSPAQSAKWLTKAWDLAEQTSDSPRDDRLKEFFSHSVKGELRTVVLGVARKHDAHLAESFLTHLAEQKCLDEKKERGAFDDRTARSGPALRHGSRHSRRHRHPHRHDRPNGNDHGLASVADRLAGFDVRQQTVAKPKYDELERRYGL